MHVYLLQSEAIDPDDKKVFLELKAGTASEAQVRFFFKYINAYDGVLLSEASYSFTG